MALEGITKVISAGIDTTSSLTVQNVNVTGILTSPTLYSSGFPQDITINGIRIGKSGQSGDPSADSSIQFIGENTFVGVGVGTTNTGGYRNTVIGYRALYSAGPTSSTNTAIGWQALYSLTGYTYYNTAIGRYALGSLTYGTGNIAMGHNAGSGVTTGSGNVCINSGGPTTGNSNIMISGGGPTTGSANILLGGSITGTGGSEGGNVIIGYVSPVGLANSSNNIILGDGSGNERLRINDIGNVGIGSTNPLSTLDVNGNINLPLGNAIRFGGQSRISFANGGVQNLDLAQILSASGISTVELNTGSSGNILRIAAGVNVRGGLIEFRGGSASTDPGIIKFHTGTTFSQNVPPERMRIDANGNVGIGSTIPTGSLTVTTTGSRALLVGTATAFTPIYSVFLDGQNNTAFELSANGSSGNGGAQFVLSNSQTASGCLLGGIAFAASGTSSSEKRGALIVSQLESSSATSPTANLAFYTTSSGSITEKVRVSAAGSFGIGTNNPAELLHVNGNIRMNAVPGTNTNLDLPVLFQTSAGTIDGGSSLTFNPAGDVLKVNGLNIGANIVYGNAASLILTTQNGNGTAQYEVTDTTLAFKTGATERARIDSSGKFGLGVSPSYIFDVFSPTTNGNVRMINFRRETGSASLVSKTPIANFHSQSTLGVTESSAAYISITGGNGANGSGMSLGCGNKETYGHHDTTFIEFYNGNLWQNTTWHWATGGTSTYQGISYEGCEFSNNRSDNQVAFTFNNSSTSTNNHVLLVRSARTTTNSTYNLLRCENGNSTGVFQVKDSGNCQNTNNSYGSSSDIKLKRDIVDASSQWDDIKNLRVRKFRWISEVKENENASYYLGLIAQEAELVSPGLIEESNDYEEFEKESIDESGNVILDENGNPQYVRDRRALGTTTKELKYSILYMKAVKALQEAQLRIETLEAQNSSQASAIEALQARLDAAGL